MKTTIVVGNPKPKSRTAHIAELIVQQVLGDAAGKVELIDLADHVDEIFLWPSEKLAELNKRVAESDFVVFASPTYKAAYTGLLKAFLDRYPHNGLQGVAAISLMTGAGLGHSLAPTTSMVPLLLELGAAVPVRGLYFNTSQMDQIDEQVSALSAEVVGALRALAPSMLAVGRMEMHQ